MLLSCRKQYYWNGGRRTARWRDRLWATINSLVEVCVSVYPSLNRFRRRLRTVADWPGATGGGVAASDDVEAGDCLLKIYF
jgi:hypothetical protein